MWMIFKRMIARKLKIKFKAEWQDAKLIAFDIAMRVLPKIYIVI